jgi:hypothetical protein
MTLVQTQSPTLLPCPSEAPLAPKDGDCEDAARRWSDTTQTWAATGEPFYEHDPNYPQRLAQIERPDAAYAQHLQRCMQQPVCLPRGLNRADGSPTIKAWMPAPRPSTMKASKATDDIATFHTLWNGYMSQRRVVCPVLPCVGRNLLSGEAEELEAHGANLAPLDNSLPPRGVALLLVLPPTSNAKVLWLLDGFAALADTAPDANVWTAAPPTLTMCSKVRFCVHGGDLAALATTIREKESCDSKAWSAVATLAPCLVLRWSKTIDSEACVRSERIAITSKDLDDCGEGGSRAAEVLRTMALRMASLYDVTMPAQFDAKLPPTEPLHFENQVAQASQELYDAMYQEERFEPTAVMKTNGVTRLASVRGPYVRVCQGALSQATSQTALYGLLLCAGGDDHNQWTHHQVDARKWAYCNYLGLPPVEDHSPGMQRLLHTLTASTTRLELGSRVSLYGIGGKPGEPIQSPNSWIWTSRMAIVPVQQAQAQGFYVLPCDARSCDPGDKRLREANAAHMKRLHDYMLRCCPPVGGSVQPRREASPARVRPLDNNAQEQTADDALALEVFAPPGTLKISSARNYLDDALVGMNESAVPKPIVQMLREARMLLPQEQSAPTVLDACRYIHTRLRDDRQIMEKRKRDADESQRLAIDAMLNGAAAAAAAAGDRPANHRRGMGLALVPRDIQVLVAHLRLAKMVLVVPNFKYKNMRATPRDSAQYLIKLVSAGVCGGVATPMHAVSPQVVAAAKSIEDPLVALCTVAKLCNTTGVRTFVATTNPLTEEADLAELCLSTAQLKPCDRFAVASTTPRALFTISWRPEDGMVVNCLVMRSAIDA